MKEAVTLADGQTITLHYRHWLPRLMGGANLCMTVSARHILVQQDWITAKGLAHECGHVMQPARSAGATCRGCSGATSDTATATVPPKSARTPT